MLSTRVLIGSTSARIGAEVHRLLAPFSAPVDDVPAEQQFLVVHRSDADNCCLHRDGQPVAWSLSLDALLGLLLNELNRAAIDGFGGFAAHAGVVAIGHEAVAFPAASGGGKTTMVAACLAAGLGYVSDEALCVELGSGALVPYPKPLQLSPASCRALQRPPVTATGDAISDVNVTAGELGGEVACPPLELCHVVQLVRRPGPDVLTEIPPVSAAAWLLELSFNHYKRPHQAFRIVTRLARRSRAWRLEYSDAPPAAVLVADRLAR